MSYLFVAAGLIALMLGGDILVRGAVSLAERLGVPHLVIGLTVVAFGTSAPELVVCLDAALRGFSDVAIGNVVGSNIANIFLVMGLPALIFPVVCAARGMRRDSLFMLAISFAFVGLCLMGPVRFGHGVAMLGLLAGYLIWSYCRSAAGKTAAGETIVEDIEGTGERPRSLVWSLGFIVLGLLGLVGGAHMLIEGAVNIARAAGLSEAVIGLTLVALGTSLPELATAVMAALRKHGDVAVGNIIGSNIFNILGIMGATALVVDIPIPLPFLHFDFWVMLAAAILLVLFTYFGNQIKRLPAAALVGFYAAYIWALVNGYSAMSHHAELPTIAAGLL